MDGYANPTASQAEPQVHDRKSSRLDGIAFVKVLDVSAPHVAKMIGA